MIGSTAISLIGQFKVDYAIIGASAIDEEGALLAPQTADIALPSDRDRLELEGDWVDGQDWIEAKNMPGRPARTYAEMLTLEPFTTLCLWITPVQATVPQAPTMASHGLVSTSGSASTGS